LLMTYFITLLRLAWDWRSATFQIPGIMHNIQHSSSKSTVTRCWCLISVLCKANCIETSSSMPFWDSIKA
jgi:hypothetical protein